jgi:hypothetical protein
MTDQEDKKKKLKIWGGDPGLEVKLREIEALLDGLDPGVEEIKTCRSWLEAARASLKKRIFGCFLPYQAYDEVWAFLNLIRHILCRHLPPERLPAVILQVRSCLCYVLEEEQQKALKEGLIAIENDLAAFTVPGMTPPPPDVPLEKIRLQLERASRICGEARETHWRKVNLIRTRLLTTALVLVALLLLTFILVPTLSGCAGLCFQSLLAVAVFGALGGLVSALRTREAIDTPSSTYYIQRTSLGLRPVVGAAAGVVVYLIQLSGIITFFSSGSCAGASHLVLAFVAGFSERFFIAQIETLASRNGSTKKGEEKPPPPEPAQTDQ